MNEQNDETLGGSGFETEVAKQKEQEGQAKPKPAPKRSLSDEMKRNFKAVFGHGVGKISLILAAVIVIGGITFGYRGLTSKPKEMAQSEVDVPNAPQPTIELGDISKQESIRRAQQAALEAEEAAALNHTYQPGFDVNIVNKESLPSGAAQFNMPNEACGGGEDRRDGPADAAGLGTAFQRTRP